MIRFQSSPVTEDRCNVVDQRIGGMEAGFNPHRSLRTGATFPVRPAECGPWFQSSPVTEDRCNVGDVARRQGVGVVSILTGH